MTPSSASSAGNTLSALEVLEDLQATVGFEQLDDQTRSRLLQRQHDAFERVQDCIDGAGDAEDLVLPRALEKELAEIYALKEQAVASKRAALRDRSGAWEREAASAANSAMTPDQQEQMQGVVSEIGRKTAQVKQEIDGIHKKKDVRAESTQRGTEAAEIEQLRKGLQQGNTGTNPDRGPQNNSSSRTQDAWSR